MVILITGKRGAGKTTYANRLMDEYRSEGVNAVVIDSDVVRLENNNNDFTDEGRAAHLELLARMAAKIQGSGFVAIVAAIAPRRELRVMMRQMWGQSRLVYLPGGSLWKGTTYERPDEDEY